MPNHYLDLEPFLLKTEKKMSKKKPIIYILIFLENEEDVNPVIFQSPVMQRKKMEEMREKRGVMKLDAIFAPMR